jgi:hypothetical protein
VKRARGIRCKARGIVHGVLRPRDLDALGSIAAAGYLTTGQLERLHYGSRRVAQRRLRVLLDHELVVGDMQGEHLQKETVFRTTARGLERLLDEGRGVQSRKRPRLPRPGKLRHGIAVRDVYVAARLHERAGGWMVTEHRFDSELAGDPVLRAARLIPDVLVRAVTGGHHVVVFAEVDLGSEPVSTVRAKLDRYDALREAVPEYGTAEVIVLVEGDARRRRVEEGPRRAHVRVMAARDLESAFGACTRMVCAPPLRAERTPPGLQVRGTKGTEGLQKRGM